jgi:hypothetical protein
MGIRDLAVRAKKPLHRRWWPRTPEPGEVDELIDDPRCTGLAVILGEPSGGLVGRDFDDRDAYHRWAGRNPRLARELPTDEGARGFHVYARSPGARTLDFEDGELKGAGSYLLLPPSLTIEPPPGAPAQYRWITPFPDRLGRIPEVDPAVFYPPDYAPSLELGEAEGGGADDPPGPQHGLCQLPIHGIHIPECIRRSLPRKAGERHRCLFTLARNLRAILPDDTGAAELKAIAADWYERARYVIRTKDLRLCQRELVDAWKNATVPAGYDLARILEYAAADTWRPRLGGAADRIARVLRAAGRAHGWRDFPLDYRHLAEAVGVSPQGAHKSADLVERAGYVRRVDRGKPGLKARKATRWQWTRPEDVGDAIPAVQEPRPRDDDARAEEVPVAAAAAVLGIPDAILVMPPATPDGTKSAWRLKYDELIEQAKHATTLTELRKIREQMIELAASVGRTG